MNKTSSILALGTIALLLQPIEAAEPTAKEALNEAQQSRKLTTAEQRAIRARARAKAKANAKQPSGYPVTYPKTGPKSDIFKPKLNPHEVEKPLSESDTLKEEIDRQIEHLNKRRLEATQRRNSTGSTDQDKANDHLHQQIDAKRKQLEDLLRQGK